MNWIFTLLDYFVQKNVDGIQNAILLYQIGYDANWKF